MNDIRARPTKANFSISAVDFCVTMPTASFNVVVLLLKSKLAWQTYMYERNLNGVNQVMRPRASVGQIIASVTLNGPTQIGGDGVSLTDGIRSYLITPRGL